MHLRFRPFSHKDLVSQPEEFWCLGFSFIHFFSIVSLHLLVCEQMLMNLLKKRCKKIKSCALRISLCCYAFYYDNLYMNPVISICTVFIYEAVTCCLFTIGKLYV